MSPRLQALSFAGTDRAFLTVSILLGPSGNAAIAHFLGGGGSLLLVGLHLVGLLVAHDGPHGEAHALALSGAGQRGKCPHPHNNGHDHHTLEHHPLGIHHVHHEGPQHVGHAVEGLSNGFPCCPELCGVELPNVYPDDRVGPVDGGPGKGDEYVLHGGLYHGQQAHCEGRAAAQQQEQRPFAAHQVDHNEGDDNAHHSGKVGDDHGLVLVDGIEDVA
mmetsp:Transcript_3288/g.9453  ORF Transcript_3288/g.9453 Transcript_3288/m.9453 type:complete len:217 (+) Transcript_3288:1401-2051(+)